MTPPRASTRLARRSWPRVWAALLVGPAIGYVVGMLVLTSLPYPPGPQQRLLHLLAASAFTLAMPIQLVIGLFSPFLLRRPLPPWMNALWLGVAGVVIGLIPGLLFVQRIVSPTVANWTPPQSLGLLLAASGLFTALLLRWIGLRRVPADISKAFE